MPSSSINALDVSGIAKKLEQASTHKDVYRLVVEIFSEVFSVSRCIFVPADDCRENPKVPIEWSEDFSSNQERDKSLARLAYYLQDLCRAASGVIAVSDAGSSQFLARLKDELHDLDISSLLTCALSDSECLGATIILIQENQQRSWQQKEKELLLSVRPLIVKALKRTEFDATAKTSAVQSEDNRYFKALYEVSLALSGELSADQVVDTGVTALSIATRADAALCFMLRTDETEELQLAGYYGFSAAFAQHLQKNSNLPNLSLHVVQHSKELIVDDMRSDPRASRILIEEQGITSSILVPIKIKDSTIGVLGLFSKRKAAFSGTELYLVRAAASQFSAACFQARLLERYVTQGKSLSTLYRISHELAKPMTLDTLFQRAFKVIREELGLKRLWIGLLNDPGTRIIGQAAYGPGLRKRLVEVSVELEGRDHPIARVIESQAPLIIDDPEQVLQAFGVKKIFSRLEISSIVLVPLIAGGQLHGVMAVQPQIEGKMPDQDQLSLLMSLASEVATMVLSKRLEERLASGEKMRTAALLAAGIAHNFNNILQAIMGQASLLEMQNKPESRVFHAAGVIKEASQKGAQLVKQLLSVANLEDPRREIVKINTIIEQGLDELSGFLKEGQEIDLDLDDDLPKVFVDPRHLMRILRTLVSNAVEAMDQEGVIEIFTDSVVIGQESPHYEVPFGSFVRIGVRDSGIGMDSEMKRRCFEPFFTTKDVDPGSGISMSGAGLGLSAAYALSRRNGGRLVVDSRPGHGTLFTLYVRVADKQAISGDDLKIEESFFENPKLTSIESYQKQKMANREKE